MPDPGIVAGPADAWRARCEAALATALPAPDAPPQRLHAAMRHAVLDGGKRIRPLLVYATAHALGDDRDALDAPAIAVELVHAYSLVHDDLPAMDDDALRRGKPTVHVAFDEATAILAGDALQALAFEQLATAALPADIRVAMLRELAVAAGARGMCGGQALDIDATGQNWGQSEVLHRNARPNPEDRCEIHSDPMSALQRMHALKTGALLRASVRLGALAADADAAARQALDAFADALGLAFQIRDDLLDIEGDSATLGKTAGKDVAQAKATFPALLGIEASRARLQQLAQAMQAALAGFDGGADPLRDIARQVVTRDR